WNFETGDGLEKAVLMANVLRQRAPQAALRIQLGDGAAVLKSDTTEWRFESRKELGIAEWVIPH
ncbi:MAG: hypothetical protein HN383_16075, partial [Verrucomicrobia bacterium]|nr:hypothetical protein [Verrucomicrobiota bacterium]